MRLLAEATRQPPTAVVTSPVSRTARAPRRSTAIPETSAVGPATARANAPTAEMKLRDQPKSCCQIGMTRPSDARRENATARAKKETIATPSKAGFECEPTMDAPQKSPPRASHDPPWAQRALRPQQITP